jgi:hypothetical protein
MLRRTELPFPSDNLCPLQNLMIVLFIYRANSLVPRFRRSAHTGNVALGGAAAHAVLIESAG